MTMKARTQAVAGRGKKGNDFLHVVDSSLSVEEAARFLPEAAKHHEFGVLGCHDLKGKLNEKGLAFENDCLVFDVCSPRQAHTVLSADMRVSTALPCRITIYKDGGTTKVATIKPTALLELFGAPKLRPVAEEVERSVFAIMDELR